MNAVEPIPFESERAKELRRLLISFSDIQPSLENNYIVQGWLGSGGLSVLYGPSNSGKTLVATDLALHVASGVDWRGQKVRQGPVVYVAAEGGGGIRNRVSAIRQARPKLAGNVDFFLLPTHLDLYTGGDAMALCSAMPTEQIMLIVIDTMARSLGVGDENSARDVAQFVANLDAIREKTGAHVQIVHHSGKDPGAGARGSSALRAAVDTEIAVSDHQISCTKQRDMEIPTPLFFDFETVELGTDQGGDPVTSAIVVPADAPQATVRRLTVRDKVAEKALCEALRLYGQERKGENFPQNRQTVEIAKWREQCRASGLTDPEAPADTQRKAFDRSKRRLLDRDTVGVFEEFVWKIHPDV